MFVSKAEEKDFALLQEFIIPHEYLCAALSSFVRKKDSHIYYISEKTRVESVNDIKGLFYLEGSLLHCIPQISEELLQALISFLKDKKVRAIDGEESVSLKIIEGLGRFQKPFQINKYQLMILKEAAKASPEELSEDDEIIRCTENDIDLLFDLQKQYLLKEVAPQGKKLTDLECKMSLRQILKNQLVFALFSDGELVSKANTNAIGINYVQLGGVYTHPLYRKNYYAWNLVKLLCDRIQKTKKTPVLFVKEKNIPALSLYKAIGFSQAGNFVIAYY